MSEQLILLLAVVPVLFIILCMILRAVGKCGCAYKMGLGTGWMAFIPFLNAWLAGRMAEFSDKECRKAAKKTPKWSVLCLVVRVFSVLFGSASLSALLVLLCTLFFKQNRFARNLMTFIFAQTESEFLAGARTVVMFSVLALVGGALLFAATKVLDYLMTYKIFYAFTPRKAGVCFVLSFFILAAEAVIFMVLGFSKKFVPVTAVPADEYVEAPAFYESEPEKAEIADAPENGENPENG